MSTAHISSINILNPILNIISTDNNVYTTPNQELWNAKDASKSTDDSFLDVDGSMFPASVDIQNTEPTIFRVSLYVDDDLSTRPFLLEARLRGTSRIAWSTIIAQTGKAGYVTLDVKFQPPWVRYEFPWGVAGDLLWRAVTPGQPDARKVKDLERPTRIEIYGLTSQLPKFFFSRVRVDFLRALVLPAHTSGAIDWTRYVIKAAFWDFGFKYASFHGGAARYAAGSTGGTYDLRSWAREIGTKKDLNCYDQAGLLQIALGLGPLAQSDVMWKYMKRYGFLRTTELVGRGLSNNPFPRGPDAPDSLFLIDNNNAGRSGFSNHAFIEVNGRIADACAGPHMGTESLQQYIDAAIQSLDQTDRYNQDKSRPGQIADAIDCEGVTSLDRSWIRDEARMQRYVNNNTSEAIKRLMELADTGEKVISDKLLGVDVPAIGRKFSQTKSGLTPDARINQYGGQVSFTIPETSVEGLALQETQITILRMRSCNQARLHFQYRLDDTYHNVPDYQDFHAAKNKKGQLNLVGDVKNPQYSINIWVQQNVFVRVEGPFNPEEMDQKYAIPLYELLKSALQADPFVTPKIATISSGVIAGSRFTIKPNVGSPSSNLDSDSILTQRQVAKNLFWHVQDADENNGVSNPL